MFVCWLLNGARGTNNKGNNSNKKTTNFTFPMDGRQQQFHLAEESDRRTQIVVAAMPAASRLVGVVFAVDDL